MNASNIPESITPEVAAWCRLQMTIAAARAIEPLKVELEAQSAFTDGLFVVLVQLLPQLLIDNPTLRERVAPHWRQAARRHDELEAGDTPMPNDDAIGVLEARKLIFNACAGLGIWGESPAARTERAAGQTHDSRRHAGP